MRIMWRFLLAAGLLVCGVRVEEMYNQPLYIPRCCDIDHVYTLHRSCIYASGAPFEPKAVVDGAFKVLSQVINDDVTDISCSGKGNTVQYRSTTDGEILFVLNSTRFEVLWYPPGGKQEFVKPEEFCIARELGGDEEDPSYVAKFCAQDPEHQMSLAEKVCNHSTCVRKCCMPGEHIIDSSFCGPVLVGQEWEPVFQDEYDRQVSPPSDLHVLHGFPSPCGVILIYDDHKLLSNGDVWIPDFNLTYQDYCLDNNYINNDTQEVAMVCYDGLGGDPIQCEWNYGILKPVLLSVSCVFLALTWLVYMSVQQLRMSTTGRCLICLVTAMFVAFLSIIVLELHVNELPLDQCVATGYIGLYSILAVFFWLSIISYHIFSQLRFGKEDGQDRLQMFLKCCLVGWGAPCVVVVVGVVLDALEANAVRPGFYEAINCWFFDDVAQWCYEYGIILALIILNTGFFIASVMALKKKESYSPNSGNNSHHNIRVWVYLKMFIIMGLLWVFEVVVWHLDLCSVVTIIFDVINCLQGVYIFLVVVCFRKDLKVFHCGWPELVVSKEDNEGVSNTQEVHSLVATKN